MALALTTWLITSDVTPEIALRSTTSEDEWVLTWLPDRSLTLEQAVSGMVLDEILSDPELADGEAALELAAFRAAELGVTLREVVVQLSIRIAQRDLARNRQNVCIPAPHAEGSTDTSAAGHDHGHSRQCRCRPQTAAGRT
ncbi:MAG: hypothetical protein JWN03_5367 [Nocardia sp.]|uniref:hypothetical protein n=1 Tax=Nocardia sp. TaxID=1821 RepID=UPI002603371C|nr:hypothetical protein [Nocardia sp.]MCU1645092.1 hypothetical protein [Nocardia sp.]